VNPTRRFAVLILGLLVCSGLGAETLIGQLYSLRNYELADAYWAAGQKFITLGQADRGAEFQAQAKHLFPGFVPGQAPAAQPLATPVVPKPAPEVPAAAVVREANLQGEKVARLQFQKILRSYLIGDPAALGSALADTLTVQGQAVKVDPAALAAFLADHPAEAGTPDDLFALSSFVAADGPGQTVQVTVRASADAPADLAALFPFWKEKQTYTFDRVGDTWKLTAVAGQ
jgi:hypothetical protein